MTDAPNDDVPDDPDYETVAKIEVTVAAALGHLIREAFVDPDQPPCRECFNEAVERYKRTRLVVASKLDFEHRNVNEPAKAALQFAWQAWNAYLIALDEPRCQRHGGRPASVQAAQQLTMHMSVRVPRTRRDGSA